MAERADTANPLRVLWLIKGLGPGGAEHLLVQHAAVLDPHRYRVTAARVVGFKDDLVPRLEAAGVRCVLLGGRRGRSPLWPWRLRRLMRDADVVHVHSPVAAAVARLLARTGGVGRPAVVYTEHNRWPSYRLPTRLVNRWTYRLNDAVLAVSNDAADSVSQALRGAVEVLEHGIDRDAVRAAADRDGVRSEWGVTDNVLVVGCVANCRVEKDLRNLLEATRLDAARTPRDGDPPLLVVHVGQGPLASDVARWRDELGLGDDRLRLLGGRDDAVRLMSGFDVFTLSSAHEGLPVALMEAMSLGLPSVCTAVGGVPDALGALTVEAAGDRRGVAAGIVVAPHDARALAAGWRSLADSTRRREMGEAARARSARFDVTGVARHIESVWRRVAQREAEDASCAA